MVVPPPFANSSHHQLLLDAKPLKLVICRYQFISEGGQLAAFLSSGLELPEALKQRSLTRQCQYLAGRHCARMAISQLAPSTSPAAVMSGANGQPLWPAGFFGSISHCAQLAIAVVCRTPVAIGIDTETLMSPDRAEKIWPAIMTSAELHLLTSACRDMVIAVTLCFSAKEAVFKALSERMAHQLDLLSIQIIAHAPDSAELTVAPAIGTEHTEWPAELKVCYWHDQEQLQVLCVATPPQDKLSANGQT